jgi:phospholipid/cholesterol/gamma-HCH transport system ATP-binding protein
LPVAELDGVTMRWGERLVLDQLHLRVEAGERLVVVGPSGSGKSTILRLLAGLLLPSSGGVRLHGVPQTYLRLDQRHPPDVRLVFQNPALLASLTVRENVGFLLYRYSRLGEDQIRERVARALEAVGLAAIEGRVPLLLFDEPTAGLDPMACTRIEDLIVQSTTLTHASGVVVSHVLSTIDRCADRVALLYDGCFRWSGTIAEFRVSEDPYVVQFRSGSLRGPMQPAER